MTTVDHPTAAATATAPATPETVLDAVLGLAPAIARRAPEIEAARRVPRDLLDELVGVGCFGLLLPRSHHGAGSDLPGALRVLEALAQADASTAWTVMIGGGSWFDLVGLPRESFDALFADRSGVIVAGVFNPTGSIAPVAGGAPGDGPGDAGYRVDGRWAFASGCEHATWIFGNSVEGIIDGAPQLRIAVFTPDQVTIEDTWNVSGLRGTGSHHIRVDDVVVPTELTLAPLADEPCLDEPVVRIPPLTLFSLHVASVAIGTAQGALDDVLALAGEKVPLLDHAALAANPLFRFELATAATDVRAARCLLYETAESVWATATAGDPFTLEQRAEARAAAVWATTRAAAVVDTAYRSGGGTSLYADCPLQRRLRDIHAVTQHFLVRPDTLTTAGAVFAGYDPDVVLF